MTNDLNIILVSVWDVLQTCKYTKTTWKNGKNETFWFDFYKVEKAAALIEKLCQPNIVIVDLDDVDSVYKLIADIQQRLDKSALAALKETK